MRIFDWRFLCGAFNFRSDVKKHSRFDRECSAVSGFGQSADGACRNLLKHHYIHDQISILEHRYQRRPQIYRGRIIVELLL